MPYRDTAVLPVMWRGSLVTKAVIDNEFLYLLSTKTWHPASLERPSSPRTSVVVFKRTYHLILSRVVFVLSKYQNSERDILWADVERLSEYCRRVPDLKSLNGNPFDCTVGNLVVVKGEIPIKNVEVDFEGKITFPLTALFPASGLSETGKFPLSRLDPDIVQREVLDPLQSAPSISELVEMENPPIDVESRNTITEMLNILGETPPLGEQRSS